MLCITQKHGIVIFASELSRQPRTAVNLFINNIDDDDDNDNNNDDDYYIKSFISQVITIDIFRFQLVHHHVYGICQTFLVNKRDFCSPQPAERLSIGVIINLNSIIQNHIHLHVWDKNHKSENLDWSSNHAWLQAANTHSQEVVRPSTGPRDGMVFPA